MMRVALRLNGLFAMALVLMVGLATGCGSDDGSGKDPDNPTGQTKLPQIEFTPAETCSVSDKLLVNCSHTFDQSQVSAGDSITWNLRIRNSGERELKLSGIDLSYTAPAEGEDPLAFEAFIPGPVATAFAENKPFFVATAGNGTDAQPEELVVGVSFTRYEDDQVRSAKLVIKSDASNVAGGNITIDLKISEGFAKITVSPDWVDFGQAGMGEIKNEKVAVLNTGSRDLEVTGFKFVGSQFFSVVFDKTEYKVGPETQAGVDFGADMIIVSPQMSDSFTVRFRPENEQPATGTITLFSNDPSYPNGVDVRVTGNEDVPCIEVNPAQVAFGGKKYGELAVQKLVIGACGKAPVELYDLTIKEGSSADFGVDLSSLTHVPTRQNPVIVPIGGAVEINVTFVPDAPNPLDGNGNMILDQGTLVIKNNSFQVEKEVPLSGAGVEVECPTAVIRCAEGDEVIPQTNLHLFGDESYAPNGVIQKWEWRVDQPVGSQSIFVPAYTFPNPTFEANVAGAYMFELDVFDGTGMRSCIPARYEVLVIPDEAIHIELLWHTPNDPDETDTGPGAGADLDLHFLHPWAAGPDLDGDGAPDGWFDNLFDCFWFNPHPNWGSYDPAINDDPSLDRDDTDGAGPENINLDIPEEGVTYRVGVHYWNDHGYGPSYATLRVYIYAALVFEQAGVMLLDKDMWEVCTVDWPSGKVVVVTGKDGGYKITPNYENPYFFQN